MPKYKKSFIIFFSLFFWLSSLTGCISAEKTAYETDISHPSDSLSEEAASSREIAHLKNISLFEENNFQFIAKQIKEVIKNYIRMKKKLSQIEAKLDQLLRQLTLRDQKSKSAEITEEPLEREEDGLEWGQPAPQEEAANNEPSTKPETESPLEESLTDDTDTLPAEKTKEGKYPQKQKRALNSIQTDSPLSNKKSYLSLIEAKNLFKQKSYESAISKFQKYRDENPQGNHYPEATFYIGQSFRNLKMPIEAEVFFKEIVKSHPQSLWASRAKKLLEK